MRIKKINTVGYVHWGGKLVCTDELEPDAKRFVAAHLKCAYLNGLYQGRYVFTPVLPEELTKKYHVDPY